MPGSIPGLPGFAAFAALKFGGYVLAGIALKKLQPAIQTSAITIAGWRTFLGIVLGPLFSFGFIFIVLGNGPEYTGPPYLPYLYYPALIALRICVWAIVIFFVYREALLSSRKLWLYSVYGALWSCFLDLPAFALAWVSPGKMPFC